MNVTIHAIERYNERVLNSQNKINIKSFKGKIIHNRILNGVKKYYELIEKDGYYRIEANVYGLLIKNKIITIVLFNSPKAFIESDSCKEQNKKKINENRFFHKMRKEAKKRDRKSRNKTIKVNMSSCF